MANLLWIQTVCCGGETASLLNSDHPHLRAALRTLDVTLLGHPYLHGQSRGDMQQVLRECAAGSLSVDLLELVQTPACLPADSWLRSYSLAPIPALF